MIKIKPLNNQLGFGMMEIIVAIMLVALTALFTASVTKLSQNASSYSDNKSQAQALNEIIYNRFKFEKTCGESFAAGSGLNMTIDTANAALMASSFENAWPISFKIPNLRAGLAMNLDTLNETASDADRSILPRRLKLEKLRLANGVLLSTNAGVDRTYAADIYVQFSEIGGISLKAKNIGTVLITANDLTGAVTSCRSLSEITLQSTCADMGCQYLGGAQPCKCFRSQIVCAAPGYFPVAFSAQGVPDCRAVGGNDCPAGQYMTEFGIDYIGCAPAPVCPAGTANDGLGAAANPPLCKCNGAGETWNGTNCVVTVTTTTLPPTTDCAATTLSWTVGANTCSDSVPLTSTGGTRSLRDLTRPTTGYAVYNCTAGSWIIDGAQNDCVTSTPNFPVRSKWRKSGPGATTMCGTTITPSTNSSTSQMYFGPGCSGTEYPMPGVSTCGAIGLVWCINCAPGSNPGAGFCLRDMDLEAMGSP